ncbi:cytochrome c556 [Bradyrhizobium macuxiense]|uniref:Cytochrome c556 n=1 Tax=Bradyrhizobium macuxiense TaxID=1755647 RepID=A0A560KVK5_9BRAD|nr:cytochrome c [Bradyrhizobium macuxiense]TWB87263.1 cytochrome c556 [Bradyrhizobium macuxiense]
MFALGFRCVAAGMCVAIGLAVLDAAAGPAEVAQIKSRQGKFRDMGGALKAINDELKKRTIDWDNTVAPNAQTIKDRSGYLPNWFPKGSGPESGAKTYALPAIWQNSDDFVTLGKVAQVEAAKLNQVAISKDANALKEEVEAMGKACKACHDSYRSPDYAKQNDD